MRGGEGEKNDAQGVRTDLKGVQGLVCLVTHKKNLPETPYCGKKWSGRGKWQWL